MMEQKIKCTLLLLLSIGFAVPQIVVAVSAIEATKIIEYQPAASGGETKEGKCWTNSIAASRPDAWRCMVKDEIYDPCFALAGGNSVLCKSNPATGDTGFNLKLTEPLPKPDIPADAAKTASKAGWLVELADGVLCMPVTGARGMVGGKMVTYHCKNRFIGTDIVLLDDLDTTGQPWTVEKAVLVPGPGGPSLLRSNKIAVKTVWQ